MPATDQDSRLFERYRTDGDLDALAAVFDQNAPVLLRAAQKLSSCRTEAEDLVQATFLTAIRRADSFRADCRVLPWLMGILANHERDLRRRRAVAARIPRSTPPPVATPLDTAMTADLYEIVDASVARLPQPYREVLELHLRQGLTAHEVAAHLDREPTTVRTQILRGLARLRDLLPAGFSFWLLSLITPYASLALIRAKVLGVSSGTVAASGATASLATPATPYLFGLLMTKKLAAVAVLIACVSLFLVQTYGGEGDHDSSSSELSDAGENPASADVTKRGEDGGASSLQRSDIPSNGGPIHGRIVYAGTTQGVPFYEFKVRGGNRTEALRTDRDGTFASRSSFPLRVRVVLPGNRAPKPRTASSAAAIEVVEAQVAQDSSSGFVSSPNASRTERNSANDLVRSHADEDVEITAHLGPTYFFDLSVPASYEVSDFRASLGADGHLGRVKLRRAADWVRFPRVFDPDSSMRENPHLVLASTDGRWRGRCAIDSVVGVHTRVLRVELHEFGCVTGEARDRDGVPIGSVRLGLQESDGQRTIRATTNSAGRFRFTGLKEGRHVLYVGDSRFEPQQTTLEVTVGAPIEHHLVLVKKPLVGRISGVVRSATGNFRGFTFLFLSSLQKSGEAAQDVWRRTDIEWKRGANGFEGRFSFDDLCAGEYRLVCNTVDVVPIAKRSREVRAPSNVEFKIRDDAPKHPLSVSVFDDADKRLDSYTLLVQMPGGFVNGISVSKKSPLRLEVAEGVDIRWRVIVDGYRIATGQALSNGPPIVARLKTGFGAFVLLASIESMRLLPGVQVFADNRLAGVSNADGHLFLDLETRPKTLSFDPKRWRVHRDGTYRSCIDPDDGTFKADDRHLIAAYLRAVK